MEEAMKITPSERFVAQEKEDLTSLPAPLQGIWQGGEKYIIDQASGKLATSLTPIEARITLVVPNIHTILHWINKNSPRGIPPINPQNDSQYLLWEIPVREWVLRQGFVEGDRSFIPTEYDTSRTPDAIPVVSMSGVDYNKSYKIDENISFYVSVVSKYPVSSVEFYLNGELVDKKNISPFIFSFLPSSMSSIYMKNIIDIVVYDSVFNKGVFSTQLIIEE